MSLAAVRILGWLVIAHALSHAVLPLRGSLAPGLLNGDWMPAGLYVIAMIGFSAAGLGLLGMRPFDRAVSPLLVFSSGLSLVAIVRLGDPGLSVGAASDIALLLIGLWRAAVGWPMHPRHGRVWHVLALTAGCAFLGYVAFAAALFPWHRTWGSTRAELTMALPGDQDNRNPALELQHAVTIDAPPEAVWPWLVQLGQDRAGFYSYDWLERAAGVEIRNTTEIRPDWQTRQVGDFVRATQPTYLGGLLGADLGWKVSELHPRHALVLESWGAFVLLPTGDGRTRFIVRSRLGHPDIPIWAAALEFMTFELPHFIMERRMMLTIKELAEGYGRVEAALR